MRRIYRALALASMMVTVGCSDGREPLVLYSPHGRDLLVLLEDSYEALNPDVDVRWLDMGSQEVYDRIRSEAVNPQADVWFGGPDTIFARGAEEDLLAEYRPSWADALPDESRHPGDLYFGLYEAVPVLVYNADAVDREQAPRDWDDLLAPRWKDQLIIRDPLASGTMRTVFGMVLARSVEDTGDEQAGLDWLLRLDRQTKEYAVNPALLFEKLNRQEGLVSIWELTDMLFLQQRGAPLAYTFPASGTPVIDDSIGLVAGARHPEQAKRFIEWVGGRDSLLLTARQAFRLPARSDIPAADLPEWAREAQGHIVRSRVDWALIRDRGAEWMKLWDREVRSRG